MKNTDLTVKIKRMRDRSLFECTLRDGSALASAGCSAGQTGGCMPGAPSDDQSIITRFKVDAPPDNTVMSSVMKLYETAGRAGMKIEACPAEGDESPLWKPLRIGNLTSKNRFAVLPMEAADACDDGTPSASTVQRYTDFCRGGYGLVWIEAASLEDMTRTRRNQLMLDVYDASSRRAWEKFIGDMKKKFPDTVILFQYQHGGETVSENAPRKISVKHLYGFGGDIIDAAYIDSFIDREVETARFLHEIGADGVDLKMCHGYLGSQILRPYNDRNWKYGGSWENRSRFAFDPCERIRDIIPDRRFLLGARVSMYEEMPGGQGHAGPDSPCIDLTESVALIKGMEARGCDFFGETIGNGAVYSKNMCPVRSCAANVYQHASMARLMKENLRPETVVIGAGLSVLGSGDKMPLGGMPPEDEGFKAFAEKCIRTGVFDMAGLGRQAFADPYMPLKMQLGVDDMINWCKTCNLCLDLRPDMKHTGCVIYDRKYKELLGKARS